VRKKKILRLALCSLLASIVGWAATSSGAFTQQGPQQGATLVPLPPGAQEHPTPSNVPPDLPPPGFDEAKAYPLPSGTGQIVGSVTSLTYGRSVAGASVELVGTEFRVVTGPNGVFEFPVMAVPPGESSVRFDLIASAPGEGAVDIEVGLYDRQINYLTLSLPRAERVTRVPRRSERRGQQVSAATYRYSPPRLLWKGGDPAIGSFLVDWEGRTVYRSANDAAASTCYDDCAARWPPFLLPADVSADDVPPPDGVVERRDGTLQISYEGSPLYHYVGDEERGDTNGHGIDCIWFAVVRRSASQAAGACQPPALRLPDWTVFTNDRFGLSLKHPADWQPYEAVDPHNGIARYLGTNGFFVLIEMADAGGTAIDACRVGATHQTRPFGTDPSIQVLTVDGREGCLVWQSGGYDEAAAFIRVPDSSSGILLYADPAHMTDILSTLAFASP
jgi:predicted lipoprotein with Yx(FWY)xxD motif